MQDIEITSKRSNLEMKRNECIELKKEPKNVIVKIFTIGGKESGESSVFLLYIDNMLMYSILIDCFEGCDIRIKEIINKCGLKNVKRFKFNNNLARILPPL